MRANRLLASAAASCLGVAAALPACAKADPCGELGKLSFPNTTITNAQLVAAGAFRPARGVRRSSAEIFSAFDELPAFCRVQAIIAPSSDSHIEVEVWLPVAGWNGKFLGTGNGGCAGSIGYPRLGERGSTGYVGASPDTGQQAEPPRCEGGGGAKRKRHAVV